MLLYNKFEGYCSEMLSPHNFNGIALTSFGIFVFTNGLFFYFCKQGLLEIMTSKVTKIYRYHNDSKRQEQNQELPFHSHPTHPTQLGCSSLSGSEYNVSYPVTSPLLGMASLGFKAKCTFPQGNFKVKINRAEKIHNELLFSSHLCWYILCLPGS